MRRREFITGLGSALIAWPPAVGAQQFAMPVVGFLHAGSAEDNRHITAAWVQGLSQTGYIDGKNLTIEYRWADNQYDRLPALASDLVHREVAVLQANTPIAALAAKNATTSIPIVFSLGSDPVKDGIVANLNRPGGNITGVTFFANLLDEKRLELVHQLVPNLKIIGVLVNPKNRNANLETHDLQAAAHTLGIEIIFSEAKNESEIDQSITDIAQQHVSALIVAGDALFNTHGGQIAKLAMKYALPTSFSLREPAVAGGLMSYGASITETQRQAGVYVGRILKGDKPGDLPVQQPSKFEFVLNLKTAKALGITVPVSMQLLADEVIE